MKFRRMLGYVAVALVCVMIGSGLTLALDGQAQAEAVSQQAANNTVVVTSPFTAAIAQVRGSVVGVSNYQTVRYTTYSGFGFGYGGRGGQVQEQEVEASTGSGVVIADGYVLTNYHVVEDATRLMITVAKEGEDEPTAYDAALVASDENVDIAIIYCPELKLPAVTLGDSDTLQVGDWAICIGNPLGVQFAGTVTSGIVSALNRSVSSSSYDKYGRKETVTNAMIQVDAAINSGNSGGGMFSVSGELMGIPTLKYTGSVYTGSTVEGIGMCIPINAAKPLIEDVLSGKIETPEVVPSSTASSDDSSINLSGKPRMGITISSMNANSSVVSSGILPRGVYVSEVEAGGPAEAAGMQAGDIIVDVNDNVITSTSELQSIVAKYKAGDTLQVKVYRVPGLDDLTSLDDIPDGEYMDLEITLAVIDDVKQ